MCIPAIYAEYGSCSIIRQGRSQQGKTHLNGKFQGQIAATTPTGCFMVTMRTSLFVVSSRSPQILRPSSANHSIDAALQMKCVRIRSVMHCSHYGSSQCPALDAHPLAYPPLPSCSLRLFENSCEGLLNCRLAQLSCSGAGLSHSRWTSFVLIPVPPIPRPCIGLFIISCVTTSVVVLLDSLEFRP